jgi:ABC-type enterochelin transport system substrate-binding protein
MRKQLSMIAALLVVLAAGCKNQQTTTNASNTSATQMEKSAKASTLSPEDLGELGAQIKKQPNEADKLLAQRGLDEQSFAAAIRKVSENPDSAKRYTTAYKKAS